MKRLRDLLGIWDRLRYLAWRFAGSKTPIRVGLRQGPRIWLRGPETTDPGTALEVFMEQAYRVPPQVGSFVPNTIVDLGANVGYSVAHWLHAYPKATIVAFEPHPVHVALIYRHLEDNNGLWRCRVVAAAAMQADGDFYLTNAGNESTVSTTASPASSSVRGRDFFKEVEGLQIDLLKIDIEGGEYALLGDKRFETLPARMVVVEWHKTSEMPQGRHWCRERLSSLGYSVTEGAIDYGNAGLLWGWRA